MLLLFHLLAPALDVSAVRNSALVFVKPHAANDAAEQFVREHLSAQGVSIVGSGVKLASEIEENKLIDQHYGSLARIAMEIDPTELSVSDKAKSAFAETYGTPWSDALDCMMRNDRAMAQLGVDGLALEPMWRSGIQCKLAPGTYVSRLEGPSETLYTLNGFYPAMRHSFVESGAEVRYLLCEFDEAVLSWQSFRRDVIGATNPSEATPGSVRAEMFSRWKELGLSSMPTYGQNGVHASAGPLEGLKERCVWAGSSLESDSFAQLLLSECGVAESTLTAWLNDNPVVTLGGHTDKIFDLTEEKNSAAVLQMCRNAWEGEAAMDDGITQLSEVTAAAPPVGFEWGVAI